MPPTILQVREARQVEAALPEAGQVILSGGIVAIPTESFYGLAVNALDERAIRRLVTAKRIRGPHPILTLIPSRDALRSWVRSVPKLAEDLMREFWPGGLTLVLEAAPHLSPLLTAGTGKIGVRLSSHPVATGLARAVGLPITGTSANLTGELPCRGAEEVLRVLGDLVDLILDGGETEGVKGSTVLDLTVNPPTVLREGLVERERLRGFIPGL